MKRWEQKQTGFTIVELLIVVVVIAILAAITIVAYNGIQQRANNSRRMGDIQTVAKIVQLFYAENGFYPMTGSADTDHRTDSKCSVGTRTTDWVPGVVPKYASALPQSDGKEPNGANSGCYKYWSDGEYFVISAWIAVEGAPQSTALYQRVGFREAAFGAADLYLCNHQNVGGFASGVYNIDTDLYKKSYTIASMWPGCSEA